MTVTATACSSMPSPRSASTEAKRATWMTPVTAASAEVIMNRMMVTRSTGTPRLRAACGFWPRPASSCRTGCATAGMSRAAPITKNQSIDIRKPPSSVPAITSLNAGGISTVIGKPPVSAIRTPRQISIVPSVTTKEWMRKRTTISPLMAPRQAPTSTAAGAATSGDSPKSRISTTAT